MEYDQLVQFFDNDEDSINNIPSLMNSIIEDDNSVIDNEVYEKEYFEFSQKEKGKTKNYQKFKKYDMEFEENGKTNNNLDVFSGSECSENSPYSENSSFTWENGDKDFALITENQIQNTLNEIKRELYNETDYGDKKKYRNLKNYKLINFEEEEDFNYIDEQKNKENTYSNYDKAVLECNQWSSNFHFLRFDTSTHI
ncbi:hypothetical protein BCR32DRAFT_264614 [Anaeromyces robustus]|uniref:Uncharacterized protein n=1 Tax=Anaeromyces robustus TaxID=1754192 RepID=A0A1Y1XML7_9FUNG|nr:hypothetical protein BCR32DRAFT_264614 [Anaeromyces robustus]|eukprot:ORX86999.1 hypothetical protein BCR32DRAFT_264614 [Anaeromyces robustus]